MSLEEKISLKFDDKLVTHFYHPFPDEAFLLFQETDRVYEETPKTCRYVTTAATALRRLKLMGYSLERVKEWYAKETTPEGCETTLFETWRKCVKLLLEKGIPADDWLEIERLLAWPEEPFEPDVESELHQFEEWAWGLPGKPDARQLYCVLLEDLDGDAPVELDCTWMAEFDFIDARTTVVKDAWNNVRRSISGDEPVILLTEGSSDTSILRLSLEALFPELVDRFQFLDFSSNLKGGAVSVVEQLKAFAACGFRNRVLAIVDHDAVARDALRGLQATRLPENLGVMHLPHLAIAEDYPTVGPQGKVHVNVNGRAVGIEMFCGRRLLVDPNTLELSPVVWRGYVDGVKAYQGEITNKGRVFDQLVAALKGQAERAGFKELEDLWLCILDNACRLR